MHIYLKEIKREFPRLKAFENDDLEWRNQAMDFFRKQEYDEAAVLSSAKKPRSKSVNNGSS